MLSFNWILILDFNKFLIFNFLVGFLNHEHNSILEIKLKIVYANIKSISIIYFVQISNHTQKLKLKKAAKKFNQ